MDQEDVVKAGVIYKREQENERLNKTTPTRATACNHGLVPINGQPYRHHKQQRLSFPCRMRNKRGKNTTDRTERVVHVAQLVFESKTRQPRVF